MADSNGYAAAATAAADAGGGLITSAFNVHEIRQNRRNANQMANTAHQREVKDLEAAGLNPVLSATGGSGASSPVVSAAQVDPSVGQVGQKYVAAQQATSASEVNRATVRKINADASVSEQTAANLAKTSAFLNAMPEVQLGLQQNELYKSDMLTSNEMLRLLKAKMEAEASSAKSQAVLDKNEIPESMNKKDMAETWFGKYIAPYLQSALHVRKLLP